MISLSTDRKGDVLVGSTVRISVNDQGIPQMPFHELAFEFIVTEANNPSNSHILKRFSTSKSCVWSPRHEGEWIIKAIPKLRLCDGHNRKMAISCELHVPPAILNINVIPRIKGKAPMTFTTNNPVVCMYTIPFEGIPEGTKQVRIAFKKKPEPPKKVNSKKSQGQSALPPRREEKPVNEEEEEQNKKIIEEEEEEEENGEEEENSREEEELKENEVEPDIKENEKKEEVAEEKREEEEEENKNERAIVSSIDGKYFGKKVEQTNFEIQNLGTNEWTYLRSLPVSDKIAGGNGIYIMVPNLEPKTVYQLKHQCSIIKTEQVKVEKDKEKDDAQVQNHNNDNNTAEAPVTETKIKKSVIELPLPIEFMTDSLKGKHPKVTVTSCPTEETLNKIIFCVDVTNESSSGEMNLDKIKSMNYNQILKDDSLFISPTPQSSSVASDPMIYSLSRRKFMWSMKGDVNSLINPVILDSSHDHGYMLVASRGEKDLPSTEISTTSPKSDNNSNQNNLTNAGSSSSDNDIGSMLSHSLTHFSLVSITGVPLITIGLRMINEQLMAVGQSHCISIGLDAKFLTNFRQDRENHHEGGEIVLLCKQEHELPLELEDTLQALFSKDGDNKGLNKELRSLMLQQRNVINDNYGFYGNNSNANSSQSKKTGSQSASGIFDLADKPRKQVSLISDLVVVLDRNMRLVWYWSAYDSILKGEWETRNPLTDGMSWPKSQKEDQSTARFRLCDPVLPSMFVKGTHFPLQFGYLGLDITGGTSINEAPDMSGDFIISFMYQDAIVRVHRELKSSGTGFGSTSTSTGSDSPFEDGQMMWNLCPGGHFGILTENEAKRGCAPDRTLGASSSLWWSHQQCARVYPKQRSSSTEEGSAGEDSSSGEGCQIVILDAGSKVHEMQTTRRPNERKSGNSRGIVIDVDERAKVATIKAEIDLGFYSSHGGDAELIVDMTKDGKCSSNTPRYFFAGCTGLKSSSKAKKSKRNSLLFVETTLFGDVLWSGRMEADVAKVIRRVSSRSYNAAAQSLLRSPKSSSARNSVSLAAPISVGDSSVSRRTGAVVGDCSIRVYVKSVKSAVEDVCKCFQLKQVPGKEDSVQLTEKTTIVFVEGESDNDDDDKKEDGVVTVSLKYNSSESVEEVRKLLADAGKEQWITKGDSENSFDCTLYGVKWVVSCL